MKRVHVSGHFTIFFLVLAFFYPDSANSQDSPIESQGYTVKPGDILQVSVWKEPELQRLVRVRPDGGISFPLAGEISTIGKTVQQVQTELEKKLAKFIRDTDVSVALETVGGNTIYVIGQVNRPGAYTENREIDVLQALAIAGGTTPFAKLNDIKILRRTNVGQESLAFKYNEVANGRNLEQNITLKTGDTVIVP